MRKKSYHIVIASIVFAMLMWVSVNMGYEYTITKHIPVVIENLKEGKALKFPIPKTVTMIFKGHGWLLAGLYFLPDVKYFIDASSLTSERFIITPKELPEHVKLPIAIQPLDVKPETLILALDEYKEKRVTVIPHLSLDYHEGYGRVGQIQVTPESITIGGSKGVVDQITEWPTVYQKLKDVSASINEEIPLDEPSNYSIQIFRSSAHIMVNVQPFAEKTFSGIAVEAMAVPSNREVIFIPPKMDVIARGGIDQLAKLSNGNFQAMIDYQTLLQDSSGIVVPMLAAPEGVKVVSRKPDRVQFYIRKRL
jgi:YbbR domain-containing protein